MSTSISNSPSKSTTRSSEKPKESKRKKPSGPRPRSVDRFTEEVRDVHNTEEGGDKGDTGISIDSPLPLPVIWESPSVSHGNGDTESREAGGGINPDLPTPTVAKEIPSITLFQGSSNFQISNTNITAIGGDATIIRFGDGQFTEVQRDLICDYIATLAAMPNINDNLMKHVLTQLIINLPRAEAIFNDYQNKKKSGPCFEGTRVALLREMANWIIGQDESRMYILSGLAGIGKSTVAYTIASRAADLNLLGASFFFSRDEADRNNAKKLFTTIAYQLCVYDECFAKAIGDVLLTDRGSMATTKSPQEQLQVLILEPLRRIVELRARPILVVVDALDECREDDVPAIVAGLSQLVRDLPSFKVILTTRPQPYLDDLSGNQGVHKLFHLEEIEDKVVDGDIRLYLKYNLSLENVKKCFRRRQWCASDEQIDTLVRAAGRLFIVASTAVRYILDKSVANPASQMQELLLTCAQGRTLFQDLDHFYTIILRNVVPENCNNQKIICRYQSVVGAVMFVSRPLPVSVLAHLIDTDAEDIHVVLDKLQSVILLGDDDIPRIYHKSFPDYLTDQARCKDPCLLIDPKIGHTQIVTCCFGIMNNSLKENILGLGDPARFMSNDDGLGKEGITNEQLQEKIPQQLRYACVYWADHLEAAHVEDADVMNGLEKFMDEHTLHWFELLSLIGSLDSAHRDIRVVMKLLKSMSSDLHQLLSDALRFISKFYDIIERSALHTYYSALPFSPTNSFLYRRFIKEARHNICSIEGGPYKWDPLVAKLSHGEGVDIIKFSLNNILFFSYSKKFVDHTGRKLREGRLKIWDAATGTPIFTIPGDRFAVTNDFSIIASYSDNIITCYNANGSTRGMMITTSAIEELALSDGSRVAAALSDGTIRLWDSRNSKSIDSFDGFEGNKWSWQNPLLKFSPTGTRLVYQSENDIVKLRDGLSGRSIADLPCGPGCKLEFSSDGSRIASLSPDRGLVQLWSSESGGLVGSVSDVGHRALAISANGSLLATASLGDVSLSRWSENREHLVKIKKIECDGPDWMAFSPDSILVMRCFSAFKLYNTHTHSFISTLSVTSGSTTAFAFSPDYARLSVGRSSGNVDLWDMRGIDTPSPPSKSEATAVTAMALSRDCSRLACAFYGGTAELWETGPEKWRIAVVPVRATYRDDKVSTVGFGPDGKIFASGQYNGTIKLWNGEDGSFHGMVEAPSGLAAMTLSNSVLVAAAQAEKGVTLWSLDTPSLIHRLTAFRASTVSISDDSSLAALVERDKIKSIKPSKKDRQIRAVRVVDVMNHTTIATFAVSFAIHNLTFLPSKSHLVAQSVSGDFLSLDLIDKGITEGPILEHLIQLPDIPLWRGVPLWHNRATNEQWCITALFPQHQTPVPVLWIPNDIPVSQWTQGPSMIALGCRDGHIILLRLLTDHPS